MVRKNTDCISTRFLAEKMLNSESIIFYLLSKDQFYTLFILKAVSLDKSWYWNSHVSLEKREPFRIVNQKMETTDVIF